MRRFARSWDLVAKSGNFQETTPLLWSTPGSSPFAGFMKWSEWAYAQQGSHFGISLVRLAELLFRYLTGELGLDAHHVANTLWRDYQRGGRSDRPVFLRKYLPGKVSRASQPARKTVPKRQARRMAGV